MCNHTYLQLDWGYLPFCYIHHIQRCQLIMTIFFSLDWMNWNFMPQLENFDYWAIVHNLRKILILTYTCIIVHIDVGGTRGSDDYHSIVHWSRSEWHKITSMNCLSLSQLFFNLRYMYFRHPENVLEVSGLRWSNLMYCMRTCSQFSEHFRIEN